MAKKKAGTGKKRAPFLDRVTTKLTKLKAWIEKTTPRFATAPKPDTGDALAGVVESIDTTLGAVSKLNGWAPPTRSPAFAVGDTVIFKKDALDELVKAGLYTKGDLDGKHEIVALAGRKVKLACGVFQSRNVTKNA